MCGICGKINFDHNNHVADFEITEMASAMAHRGPDDSGVYVSGNAGLGHRRLSIIDLSTGHQPLSNEDGTVWVVFNGEIYNFEELRADLVSRGHSFSTRTDTEVLVHLYEEYGPDFVASLRGMFAFAIWDTKNRSLMVARDRVGIKPLYYAFTSDGFLFASEIKALMSGAGFDKTVDLQAIDRALSFYYLPGERTLFKRVRKLLPGNYALLLDGQLKTTCYWDLRYAPDYSKDFRECTEELYELIRESMRLHMISDVPIGFLLSGGVDSTALLSLAVQETNKKVSTFTIGFNGNTFADERPYAKMAAKKFGTRHFEMTFDAKDFLAFLPTYVRMMEEPVCEPPAVALYYISRLAKQHVKVLISGEGGDEAFAGYPNYRTMSLLQMIRTGIPGGNHMLRMAMKLPLLNKKLMKFQPLMVPPLSGSYFSRTSTPQSFFNSRFAHFYTSDFLASIDRTDTERYVANNLKPDSSLSDLNCMLYIDTKTWLPDDLLVKADKITMTNSLELRVPLLDHKVLEFAGRLPENFKVSGFKTKHILKRAFSKAVPEEIIKRKKTGFPVPYEQWLRVDYRDFIRSTLLSSTAVSRGYFEKKAINALLQENTAQGKYPKEVFLLLVLELWHQEFCGSN